MGRSAPVRNAIGRWAIDAGARLADGHALVIGYPPSAENAPRWGHGRPVNAAVAGVIARHESTYRHELEQFLPFADDLARIPAEPGGQPGQPRWRNAFLFGLDAVSLYGYLRRRRPRRYVEVGSGFSTMFAASARRDGGLATRFTSIDPSPRADVDAICDEVVRAPLEAIDLDVFTRLEPGDVVFMDGSHRVFMNSDTTTFFLDVVPALPAGVLVGVHDIFLPEDYPREWAGWWFSEQYLLAALLLAEPRWLVPRLACRWVTLTPALDEVLAPLWTRIRLEPAERVGFTFWFEIGE